jgi:hypothetical protein
LSSEIKVDISTNSILYTVQNNNQFNENFNSLIKLSSNDNIEGYKLIDTYENDKQYWLYYELDKAEYENRKLQKKQQNIILKIPFTFKRTLPFFSAPGKNSATKM